MSGTRIRRDNHRDAWATAQFYAPEDSDRGFLARQLIRLIEEYECVCGEINARHCPIHQEAGSGGDANK